MGGRWVGGAGGFGRMHESRAETLVLFTAASSEFGMVPGNSRRSINNCYVSEFVVRDLRDGKGCVAEGRVYGELCSPGVSSTAPPPRSYF